MASASGNARRGERLKSWKEIAAFFGTDERTVRRWEGRGLPVRRIPGGARATIYAEVAELESWMRGRRGASEGTSPAARPKRGAAIVAVVAGLAIVLTGGAAVAWSRIGWPDAPPVSRHQPPQRAVDLYLTASYDWEKRTPDSLQQARDLFGRAIAEDPAYAEAYAGLAKTYLLLREYSVMPEGEAYPRARDAAERALALNPDLAEAHAALAFVTFFWSRDWPRGLAGFRRATALDPSSASAWHWYGTALFHVGHIEEALNALETAQQREPSSRSIVADKALVTYQAGRTAEAIAMLRQLVASDPEFYSPHAYLASIYATGGDFAASLREQAIAARLRGSGDRVAAVARAGQALHQGGRTAMLRAMLADAIRLQRSGQGTDYDVATVYAMLGDKEHGLQMLAASNEAGETEFDSVRVDSRLKGLYGDPRFVRLAAAVERPPPHRA